MGLRERLFGKKEVGAEAPKEAVAERRSYQEVGQQRAQAAREAIAGGLSSLRDKLGAGLGWLAKKAEGAVYGALAVDKPIIDAARATGRGILAGAEAGAAGIDFAGSKIAEGAGVVAEATRRGAEATRLGAVKAGYRVAGEARAVAGGIKHGAEAVAGAAVSGYKAADRAVTNVEMALGGAAIKGKEFVVAKSREALSAAERGVGALRERGVKAYESARDRISSAVDSFNAWRNERRINEAAKLLGVTPDKVLRLQALLASL